MLGIEVVKAENSPVLPTNIDEAEWCGSDLAVVPSVEADVTDLALVSSDHPGCSTSCGIGLLAVSDAELDFGDLICHVSPVT